MKRARSSRGGDDGTAPDPASRPALVAEALCCRTALHQVPVADRVPHLRVFAARESSYRQLHGRWRSECWRRSQNLPRLIMFQPRAIGRMCDSLASRTGRSLSWAVLDRRECDPNTAKNLLNSMRDQNRCVLQAWESELLIVRPYSCTVWNACMPAQHISGDVKAPLGCFRAGSAKNSAA